MDALQDMKYKVPGDVSVMGCDNTLFSKVKKVSLTTIEHFVVHKGMDACDIIMKKISSRDWKYTEFEPVSIYHVEYEPQIVVRGTSLYPILPASRSGNTSTLACPATLLPGALDSPTDGTIAASS